MKGGAAALHFSDAPRGEIRMSRKSEISAGLLVYRRRTGVDVLLGHPGGPFWAKKDQGSWSIPKGLVESDDLLACARREFTEETGLLAEGTATELTPVRQKSGKLVHAFAVEADLDLTGWHSNEFTLEWPPRSGKIHSYPEIDRLDYFALRTALRKIIAYQWPLLMELAEQLGASRGTEQGSGAGSGASPESGS
jgi:predicted NUDIX family NTP pyrophosphohydrolase